jgi:hypothetical protein
MRSDLRSCPFPIGHHGHSGYTSAPGGSSDDTIMPGPANLSLRTRPRRAPQATRRSRPIRQFELSASCANSLSSRPCSNSRWTSRPRPSICSSSSAWSFGHRSPPTHAREQLLPGASGLLALPTYRSFALSTNLHRPTSPGWGRTRSQERARPDTISIGVRDPRSPEPSTASARRGAEKQQSETPRVRRSKRHTTTTAGARGSGGQLGPGVGFRASSGSPRTRDARAAARGRRSARAADASTRATGGTCGATYTAAGVSACAGRAACTDATGRAARASRSRATTVDKAEHPVLILVPGRCSA